MPFTARPRMTYNTQQERINSTPAGVAAYDAARGQAITPQPLAPARPPFSEMPMGRIDQYQRFRPQINQQPQSQPFGGQPMPNVGSPQAANWMQPRQQSMGAPPTPNPPGPTRYGDLMSTVNAGLMQMRNTPADHGYEGAPIHPQQVMSYGQNQSVFLPRGPMTSSAAMRAAQGYSTDLSGRQFLATPRLLGTELPAPGQGGWMQGNSLSGAPAGVYVQSPLARPEGGLARAQNPSSPSAFMAPGSASRGALAVNAPRYKALAASQQQDRDARIVARARARGLSKDTPAVRAAIQRLSGQASADGGNGSSGNPIRPAGAFGLAGTKTDPGKPKIPQNDREGLNTVQRTSKDPVVANLYQGVPPESAKMEDSLAAIDRATDPQAEAKLRQHLAGMTVADKSYNGQNPQVRQLLDAFVLGGKAAFEKAKAILNNPVGRAFGGSWLADERAQRDRMRENLQVASDERRQAAQPYVEPVRQWAQTQLVEPTQQYIQQPAEAAAQQYLMPPMSVLQSAMAGLRSGLRGGVGVETMQDAGRQLKSMRPRFRR